VSVGQSGEGKVVMHYPSVDGLSVDAEGAGYGLVSEKQVVTGGFAALSSGHDRSASMRRT